MHGNVPRMARLFCTLILFGCTLPMAAFSQMGSYSVGTGFFVNRQGYLVTNAHVVKGCKSISIGGTVTGDARLVGLDTLHDLAVLKYNGAVPKVAPIRWNLGTLKVGDDVTVAGFPGQSGFDGTLIYLRAKLLNLRGPNGEANYLQFSNSAQKGNSGGPLMDMSGSVIGVVTGKITQSAAIGTFGNQTEIPVASSDVAVTIPFLKAFLGRNGVFFDISGSSSWNTKTTELSVAQNARDSIVHVRCLLGVL
jgi:serine protease Do